MNVSHSAQYIPQTNSQTFTEMNTRSSPLSNMCVKVRKAELVTRDKAVPSRN